MTIGRSRRSARLAAALLIATATAACAPAGTAPPTSEPAPAPAVEATAPDRPEAQRTGYSEADVRFMQNMILHHRQALEMTELARERATRDDIRMLAERIEASQVDEIEMMRQWLRSRGESVPDPETGHAHHGAGGVEPRMQGMLTDEEMARLAAASGHEFDRLFLQLMIRHHEGALTMVEELFASEGGGQEPEIFQIASHVDADQRMEIARMRAVLNAF